MANTGNRYAHICHNGWAQKAISIKRLTRFGLVSMLGYDTERCVICLLYTSEVAEEISISQAQVSRLEKNALKYMRKYV